IQYPNIQTTIKKIRAQPTGLQLTGEPWYTIPAIVDDTTGVALTESADIVENLHKT
ncbi:hypothetical protein J3R30DRAFT_3281721, partial [Lentinula aciculospora]